MRSIFLPAVIIDGNNSKTEKIVTTLVSIIKQTFLPVKIIILYDKKTYIDKNTITDILKSRDGTTVECKLFVNDVTVEYQILETIKELKATVGVHKRTKRLKKFPITHAIVIKAGLYFKATNVFMNCNDEWMNGSTYIAKFFPMSTKNSSYTLINKPVVFYISDVRKFCRYYLWKPIFDINDRFNIGINGIKKDYNYKPIRQSKFGLVSEI